MSEELSGEQPAGEEPLAPVETSEATTEQPTTDNVEPEQSDPGDDEAAKPRKKPGVHNRIDELTRQKHEALREADYWRKKAQEVPDLETLDYDDQLVAKVRMADRQERAEAAQRTAEQVTAQQYAELAAEARTKWADFDAVTSNPSLPISPEMAELIASSEFGPDVAYHLGKNPAEAARLYQMTDKQLAREIGRIEAQLTAPKPTPKVPAAPIRPVTGNLAGGTKDPAAMSMAEYVAARSKGLI